MAIPALAPTFCHLIQSMPPVQIMPWERIVPVTEAVRRTRVWTKRLRWQTTMSLKIPGDTTSLTTLFSFLLPPWNCLIRRISVYTIFIFSPRIQKAKLLPAAKFEFLSESIYPPIRINARRAAGWTSTRYWNSKIKAIA